MDTDKLGKVLDTFCNYCNSMWGFKTDMSRNLYFWNYIVDPQDYSNANCLHLIVNHTHKSIWVAPTDYLWQWQDFRFDEKQDVFWFDRNLKLELFVPDEMRKMGPLLRQIAEQEPTFEYLGKKTANFLFFYSQSHPLEVLNHFRPNHNLGGIL